MGKTIACIGEAMLELSGTPADIPHNLSTGFAGDVMNTAVYLARAMADDTVAFVSLVGNDAVSQALLAFLQTEGVDTALTGRHATRLPGIYLIENDETGERSFRYWRDASAARRLFCGEGGPDLADLSRADVIYLSGITLAIMAPEARAALLDFLPGFRANGGTFAFDGNYRARLWPSAAAAAEAMAPLWDIADIALPSVEDEMDLYDETADAVAQRFAGYGCGEAVLKHGATPPILLENRVQRAGPALKRVDTVVDATGAGDSFNAGYLSARLSGADMDAAVLSGHALACRVIGHRGAILPRA